MHRILLFFTVLAGTQGLHAQQYMIRYDLNNSKSSYYKIASDTVRVKHLDLKKNGRIVLRVDNFNPFYWNAKVTSYKNPVQEESGSSTAMNPMNIFSSGFGSLMSSLPFLDVAAAKGNGTDPTSRFLNTASDYAENYRKIQEVSEKVDELKIVHMQLQELKFDIHKTEAEIKSEAFELARKAIGTDTLTLLNVVRSAKQENQKLVTSMEQLNRLHAELQQELPTVNPDARVNGKSLKEIAQQANSSYTAVNRLNTMMEKDPNFLVDEVVQVGNLYREIANANFHFNYAIATEPDLSHLKLELYPKSDDKNKDTMVQYFQLKGKRNLKIRNSVGAAFTYFTANNTKYFVSEDSMIKKSGSDLFNPVVATFIHFYGGKTSGFRWGGAFGVGIPLTGEKKDINFLLGLTTAFGQNDPILLSVGLSGAKVNKLTNGYKLGEKTTQMNEDKLVASGYDLGGFVSVSFNLGSIGKK